MQHSGERTASRRGKRRFNEDPGFKIYFWGAVVLYKHPGEALVPNDKRRSDKTTTKKWRNRLVPSILVGVTVGPGSWRWATKWVPSRQSCLKGALRECPSGPLLTLPFLRSSASLPDRGSRSTEPWMTNDTGSTRHWQFREVGDSGGTRR